MTVVKTTSSQKSKKSFTEKEIRTEKKKERTANRRFTETNNTDYLQKADKHRERWIELERNQKVDQEKKNKKIKEQKMTEDELFEQAKEYNQKLIHDAEKKKKHQMEKEANLKERRTKAKLLMKEKKDQQKNKAENDNQLEEKFKKETNEQKNAFAQKMREGNDELEKIKKEKSKNKETFNEEAYIQKAFRRYQFDRMKYSETEAKMKALFTAMGMEEQEVEEKFKEYLGYLKKAKESDSTINIGFELDDYLEEFNQNTIQDKSPVIEDPISEEEVETHASL